MSLPSTPSEDTANELAAKKGRPRCLVVSHFLLCRQLLHSVCRDTIRRSGGRCTLPNSNLFTVLQHVSIAFLIPSLSRALYGLFCLFDCCHKIRNTRRAARSPFRHTAKEIADSRDRPPWPSQSFKARINEVPACPLSPSPSQEAESARVNSDFEESSPQFQDVIHLGHACTGCS